MQLTTYTATNGLNVSYSNTDIAFTQQEKGNLTLEGLGGGLTIAPDGNVGINTSTPSVKLDVKGTIRAEEIKVCLNQGCDFVFEDDYELMSLEEVETFIKTNKHLPEVVPAAIMEAEGINVSEMSAKLLQKIEELTLYILQQEKKMLDLQNQINELKK